VQVAKSYAAYRVSHDPQHPPPIERDPRQIYHSLWPFPALSPVPDRGEPKTEEQTEKEAAYRQLLVQGVLAVLLPTEDLENDCLIAIVGQIFSEMILGGGIGGKASEPWMLWEGITKISEVLQAHLPKSKAQVRAERSNSGVENAMSKNLTGRNTKRWWIQRSLQKSFWLALQYCFLAFSAVRFFAITLATSSSLPSRIRPTMKVTGSSPLKDHMEPPESTSADDIWDGRTDQIKQPIVKMKIWSCAANLLDLDARMPWLSATFSMLQHVALTGPGKLGSTDGMIDK
jgi:PXA domain